MNPLDQIMAALARDPSASFSDKQQVASALLGLSSSQLDAVWRALSAAGGAGAFAILAKLLGFGGFGMAVAGLGGAVLGNGLYGMARNGVGGMPRLDRTDSFGRPY